MKLYYYTGVSFKDRIFLFYLRNLSVHPGKRKLRRFITNHFFNRGIGVISDLNAKFKIKTFDYIDQELIFNGSYEHSTLELCYSLIEANDVFVDVGSNFGLYSINLATKRNCKVIAIEPNPFSFIRLLEHKKLNKLDNLFLLNFAIGEDYSISGMMCPSVNNIGNYQISKNVAEFFVNILPLQTVFDHYNLSEIKLLKIDVEGFEFFALKGIDWGKVNIQNIIMELIPEQMGKQNSSNKSCLKYLIEKGYETFTITGDKYNFLEPLPESNLWLKRIY